MDPLIILILLSVAGGLFTAILGWLESGEDFDPRKFASSVARAILAGLLSAMVFQDLDPSTVTMWTYIIAFLMGAGIDVVGHRAAGTVRSISN